MTRVLQIRLPDDYGKALESVAAATSRQPEIVARDWLVERLIAQGLGSSESPTRVVKTASTTETQHLRDRYRPEDVVVLMVGESAPAGGTFFYRADSNLFHATREAFVRGLGSMPDGEAFLEKMKDLGFWLYDMVEEPVNRQRGRPRKAAVSAGVDALAGLIGELEPDFVVGIKTSIEGAIKRAAELARFPASRIVILPFPLYQWREEYVAGLGRFLGAAGRAKSDPSGSDPRIGGKLTLHAAMAEVLASDGAGPLPARQISNEVAMRGLYSRQDGTRVDYQQILSRARKYPEMFDIMPSGIRLKPRR